MESDKDTAREGKRKKKGKVEAIKPKSLNQIHAEAATRLLATQQKLSSPKSKKNIHMGLDAASRAHPIRHKNFNKKATSYVGAGKEDVINISGSGSKTPSLPGVKGILRTSTNGDPSACRDKAPGIPSNPIRVESIESERIRRSTPRKVTFSEKANLVHHMNNCEYISDSEDDEVIARPKIVKNVKNKKRKILRKRVKTGSYHEPRVVEPTREIVGIRTRTSPKTFHETINTLTLSQRVAVIEMGLGTLLDMTVNGIPDRMGYFVVDHLDPDRMELRFGGRVIYVTEQKVHATLGLSNAGIDLESAEEDIRNKMFFRAWRSQFPTNKKVRPTDIVDRITSSGRGDDEFKVNFMVLFVNSMCECSPMGCCILSFMNKISSVEMISQINWSRYVIDCVRRSKRIWRPDIHDSYYAGPLTFLTLLYVHETVPIGVKVNPKIRPLHFWTMNMLRQRQRAGIRAGGLETAELKGITQQASTSDTRTNPTMSSVPDVNKQTHTEPTDLSNGEHMPAGNISCMGTSMEDIDVPIIPESQVNNGNAEGSFRVYEAGESSNANQQVLSLENDENFNFDDYDSGDLKMEYIILIEQKFNLIYETKWDLEQLLSEATFLFPNASEFVHYNESRESLFRDCTPEEEIKEDPQEVDPTHPSDYDVGREPTVDAGKVTLTPTKMDADRTDSLDQQSPLSPIWYSQTTYDIIDDIVEKTSESNGKSEQVDDETGKQQPSQEIVPFNVCSPTDEFDIIPSFNLGFSPIRICDLGKPSDKDQKKVDDFEAHPTAAKRQPKIGLQLRSPYLRRPVLVDRNVKPIEKRVHEYCLSAFSGADDMLYNSETGQKILRTPIETLAANEDIFTNVIDGWADVLNFEERYRSPVSPMRYFFKTNLMYGGVLLHDMYTFDERFQWFHRNLAESANFNMDIINLRNIDMLFFPFLRRRHYYCVVFNLKTHVIDILDNMERVGHIIDVYDFDIHILREMVVQHLRNIGHPSADLMEPVEDRIMEIKWRTRSNYTDCGVFCMRHMETYMGGGPRGWYTGFTTEGPGQKKQIENLRIKYCTKILLSDQNICKKLVEEEVAQFYSLSPTAQLEKKTHADVTRKYRLSQY